MMEKNCDPVFKDGPSDYGRMIIMHPLYLPKLRPWLDLKVFYIRVCNCEVDESTPVHLTVNHIPLHPDTVLEVNGRRSSIYSDCISSTYLRRDRLDKKSEEATFISTDNIRITGSVRFEVFDKEDLLLAGVLELRNDKDDESESIGCQNWRMNCQTFVPAGVSFLKGRQCKGTDMSLPMIEVYITGCFSGSPIILTKTLKLGMHKRSSKSLLDSIPEHDAVELKNDAFELSDYHDYKFDNDTTSGYSSLYQRADYIEEEDGDLSWFNTGVRVGVGISLGICLGVGVGVGLLVRSYQATSKNFKKLL